jgi:GH25 family lysozyme M1 (1,4-beta-N-acetylmuramidase)
MVPRAIRLPFVALTSALIVFGLIPAAHAARGTVPGIDISQYQQTIKWKAVDPSKVGFVIMRATKGGSYTDPSYATNLAGATANGFVVGAYHRATPRRANGDAVDEARYFLSVARNAPGDVIPALDIEETGGMSAGKLRDWVQTWVEKVHSRLGVRPMVYASPYFWRTNMGDSRWFAHHGYPLWIAHWNVSAPDVPANDWSGAGWTYWQWSSTGSLRGIPTAVDKDRFDGTDLRLGEIASLTVATPTAGSVSGAKISCGSGGTTCTRLANAGDHVTLRATPAAGATFLKWKGACSGTASTCDVTLIGKDTVAAVFGYPVTVEIGGSGGGSVSSTPGGIDCPGGCAGTFKAGSTLDLSATPDSASAFDGWSGACTGLSPSCTVTVNGPRTVGAAFVATAREEQDGAGTSFTWGSKRDRRALGGQFLTEHRAGATASFSFHGGAVKLYTVSGPSMGDANVSVDGSPVGVVQGYAASVRFGVTQRFDGFGSGSHTLTVTATGTASTKAKGTKVGVDALRWAGTLHKNPRSTDASWSSVAQGAASGGSYVVSDVAGATAALRFTGTGATLVTVRGPAMGRAELRIDGKAAGTVDLYAPGVSFGVNKTVTGLTDGPHVLRVRVLGTHRAASSGSAVAVDAWIIR